MPSVEKSGYFGVGLQNRRDKPIAPPQNEPHLRALDDRNPFQNGGFGHELEDCDKASKDTTEALFVEEEMAQYCDDNVELYL